MTNQDVQHQLDKQRIRLLEAYIADMVFEDHIHRGEQPSKTIMEECDECRIPLVHVKGSLVPGEPVWCQRCADKEAAVN